MKKNECYIHVFHCESLDCIKRTCKATKRSTGDFCSVADSKIFLLSLLLHSKATVLGALKKSRCK